MHTNPNAKRLVNPPFDVFHMTALTLKAGEERR
jgi:hypothetical protein